MSAAISLDVASGVPPFEQIRSQLASLIATGALPAGTRLPTVRDLATDLGVAVGTVGRAYRELEAAGLVTSRRRSGTVVAHGRTLGDAAVRAAVAARVATARRSGVPDDDVLALVRGALLDGGEAS
ncbi:MAG: GntR family transcriptional regulator [Actinomycetes bacterium]|nr:GntR family transcriptional regulator [Actinomycetes bacterium]